MVVQGYLLYQDKQARRLSNIRTRRGFSGRVVNMVDFILAIIPLFIVVRSGLINRQTFLRCS